MILLFRPHKRLQKGAIPMCRNRLGVEANLRAYYPEVPIVDNGDHKSAEFGGDLPSSFIESLRAVGAEVLRYVHRGVVSTVVNF
jgi:hypothetical protein